MSGYAHVRNGVKRRNTRCEQMFSALPLKADSSRTLLDAVGMSQRCHNQTRVPRQVRTFRDLFLITELLDSKAESDDVGFEAELARMSCQIERAFRFVEVLKKAAADPSNRSSIDPPLFRLSRSGSNSCCQSSLSIVS